MSRNIAVYGEKNVDNAWVERKEKVQQEARAIPDDVLITGDLAALGQEIGAPHAFDVPVFTDEVSLSEPVFTRGNDSAKISAHFPFAGDGSLLVCYHRTKPYPDAIFRLEETELTKTYTVPTSRIQDVARLVKADQELLTNYLPQLDVLSTIFTPRLCQFAQSVLEERKTELQRNQVATTDLTSLGFKIRRREDAVARAYVPINRKPLPILSATIQPTATEMEPEIEEKIYEDIVGTITAMAHAIERSPGAFQGMKEEHIRTVLLVGLNATYLGQATGETFNGAGKTDILVRVSDKNVFIAECLIWKGKTNLLKKMNEQLFTYAMWRDTKTALIIFNRAKGFTKVLETIDATISQHPQFIKKLDFKHQSGGKFQFRRHDDPQRHFLLTYIGFDIPSPEKLPN